MTAPSNRNCRAMQMAMSMPTSAAVDATKPRSATVPTNDGSVSARPSHRRRRRRRWLNVSCCCSLVLVGPGGASALINAPSSSVPLGHLRQQRETTCSPSLSSSPSSSYTTRPRPRASMLYTSGGGSNLQESDTAGGGGGHGGPSESQRDILRASDVGARTTLADSSNRSPQAGPLHHGTAAEGGAFESPSFPSLLAANGDATGADGPKFGDVVSLRPRKQPVDGTSSSSSSAKQPLFGGTTPAAAAKAVVSGTVASSGSKSTDVEVSPLLAGRRRRNLGVAVVSVALAVMNYAWQWTHPLGPIQLLYEMEQNSAPVTAIGTNGKPTVIDFWAPWCENCKYMAPTLYQIEGQYRDQVNFIMVNGDKNENWPLIEALGVDAIPHLALLEADGVVDTALIGRIPKEWLIRDLDVLIENASANDRKPFGLQQQQAAPRPLPHQMLDVFANRPPEDRRVHIEMTTAAGR